MDTWVGIADQTHKWGLEPVAVAVIAPSEATGRVLLNVSRDVLKWCKKTESPACYRAPTFEAALEKRPDIPPRAFRAIYVDPRSGVSVPKLEADVQQLWPGTRLTIEDPPTGFYAVDLRDFSVHARPPSLATEIIPLSNIRFEHSGLAKAL